MPRTRQLAVQTVAANFLIAEQSTEQSAIDNARCIAAMIEARAMGKLPPDTAGEAMDLVAKSASLSFQSRQCMVAAHQLLGNIAAELGFAELFGPGGCVPNSARMPASARLIEAV